MKKITNILITLAVLLGFASGALAAEPYVIAFQGKIVVANNPLTGTQPMRFTIWSHPTNSNPTDLVWDSGAVNVDLDDAGIFNVLLGAGTPLPYEEFDGQDLWLQVTAGGSSPLIPRHALTAVPYAIAAKNLRGGDVVLDLASSPPAAQAGAMYFNKNSNRVAYHSGTKWMEIDPAYTEQDIKSDMIKKVSIKKQDATPSTPFSYVGKDKDAIITNIRIAELHTDNTSAPYNPDYYIIRLQVGGKSVRFYAQGFRTPIGTNHFAGQDSSVNFTLPIPLKVNKGETVSIGIGSFRRPAAAGPPGDAMAVEVIYIDLPL